MEKKMSFKQAAQAILKEASEPLTPKEIVKRATERGYLQTEGATPEASMGAQLYVDVKRNSKSIFQNVGSGKFALRSCLVKSAVQMNAGLAET